MSKILYSSIEYSLFLYVAQNQLILKHHLVEHTSNTTEVTTPAYQRWLKATLAQHSSRAEQWASVVPVMTQGCYPDDPGLQISLWSVCEHYTDSRDLAGPTPDPTPLQTPYVPQGGWTRSSTGYLIVSVFLILSVLLLNCTIIHIIHQRKHYKNTV